MGDAFRFFSQHQEIVDADKIFHNQKTFYGILLVSHGNSIKSLINHSIFLDLSPESSSNNYDNYTLDVLGTLGLPANRAIKGHVSFDPQVEGERPIF